MTQGEDVGRHGTSILPAVEFAYKPENIGERGEEVGRQGREAEIKPGWRLVGCHSSQRGDGEENNREKTARREAPHVCRSDHVTKVQRGLFLEEAMLLRMLQGAPAISSP